MNELNSTDFRRLYASLTEPTVVTALGRPIGVYLPGSSPASSMHSDGDIYRLGAERIESLEDEVARLKRELAMRPIGGVTVPSLPPDFTVLSTPGLAPTIENGGVNINDARRARQKVVDEALGKINRKVKS